MYATPVAVQLRQVLSVAKLVRLEDECHWWITAPRIRTVADVSAAEAGRGDPALFGSPCLFGTTESRKASLLPDPAPSAADVCGV